MKLITITKLVPLRNETGAIYKYEGSEEMINPMNIIRIKKEPAFDNRPIISMKGGMELIVEETFKTIGKKFEEATE